LKDSSKDNVEVHLIANNVTKYADGTVLEDLDYDESSCPPIVSKRDELTSNIG